MLLDYIFFLTALVFIIIYVSCLCVYKMEYGSFMEYNTIFIHHSLFLSDSLDNLPLIYRKTKDF